VIPWIGGIDSDLHSPVAIAPFAESCIRKAVDRARHHPGFVGLADAKSEDEAAMGTAFAFMEIG
jgi:hypothetical protein